MKIIFKILSTTVIGTIAVLGFAFKVLAFLFEDADVRVTQDEDADVSVTQDLWGTSDNYEMGKVYNYYTGKFDFGFTPGGIYDDD